MKIKNFNIGDSITGTLSYSVSDLKIGEDYDFFTKNDQIVLRTNDRETILTIDDKDISSRELYDNLMLLDYPIVNILKHQRKENKIFVLLYLYENYLEENDFYFYYTPEFQRDLENRNIAPLEPFILRNFILKGTIFFQANVSNNVARLIGENYTLSVRKVADNVFRLDTLETNKNTTFNYNITSLHADEFRILRQEDYLREKVKNKTGKQLELIEVNYINYWQEYLKVEKNQTIIDLYNFGSIKYENYIFKGDTVVFELNSTKHSPIINKIEAGETLSYYSKPIREIVSYSLDGKTFKANPTHLNHKYTLDIIDTTETNIGYVEKVNSNSICIKYSDKNMERISELPKKGNLSLSYFGSRINYKRKGEILENLRDKGKFFLKNIVLFGSVIGLENEERKTHKNTIKSDTLLAMFGRDDITPTDNQKDAIRLALTTPDIALIQGPPGTGKTTIIKGLISRIKSIHTYSPQILVATEQHEALRNVVNDVETEIPPTIISFKQDDSEEKRFENISNYQKNLIDMFSNHLANSNYVNHKEKLIDFISKVVENDFDCEYIINSIEEISKIVVQLDDKSTIALKQLEITCKKKLSVHVKYNDEILNDLLRGQRLDIDSFNDDGLMQLEQLMIYTSFEYPEFSIKLQGFMESLKKSDISTVIDSYKKLIENKIFTNLINVNFKKDDQSVKGKFDEFINSINEYYSESDFESLESVINKIIPEINNPYLLRETINNYNSIFGSTCQQSAKFNKILNKDVRFDYVIIDEASRVNPIDLLIPMSLGNKVILVGDQNQLPHYLENQKVKELSKVSKEENEILYNVLKESLFERIFNLLSDSYKKRNTRLNRCITLDEQYRMNPVLGDYISQNFYDGKIKNGFGVDKKINNYNLFNGKPVSWIDIDMTSGSEERSMSGGTKREAEINYIVNSISTLAKHIMENNRKFPSVGVISYYKKQVESLQERIKNDFPEIVSKHIVCGTVDSFQGKEFDIVFLSTVRSNNEKSILKRIGFLSDNKSRINVSLSRAKNLMVIVGDSKTVAEDNENVYNVFLKNFKDLCMEVGHYEKVQV